MGRTDRAPPQAARSAYFHDSGSARQHGTSGEAPRGVAACSVKGDFGFGAHAQGASRRSDHEGRRANCLWHRVTPQGHHRVRRLGHSVKEIEFLTDPTAGEVRIASLESLNSSFLPAV